MLKLEEGRAGFNSILFYPPILSFFALVSIVILSVWTRQKKNFVMKCVTLGIEYPAVLIMLVEKALGNKKIDSDKKIKIKRKAHLYVLCCKLLRLFFFSLGLIMVWNLWCVQFTHNTF